LAALQAVRPTENEEGGLIERRWWSAHGGSAATGYCRPPSLTCSTIFSLTGSPAPLVLGC
jgi:hypothetical protein